MTDQVERTVPRPQPRPSDGRGYDAATAQERWQAFWRRTGRSCPRMTGRRNASTSWTCFPPSGDLHMVRRGIRDGRRRCPVSATEGYDVLHPIGWDSFGLNAENAAIQRNAHPAEWTYANIETQATSFRRYGLSFDWTRRLPPRSEYPLDSVAVPALPRTRPGLPKGQLCQLVPPGPNRVGQRAGGCRIVRALRGVVTKRQLTQWHFKITDYAQRLLDDMAELSGAWPERVLTMQRNWIGRSDGAYVEFAIENRDQPVRVFDPARHLYGATFFVVALKLHWRQRSSLMIAARISRTTWKTKQETEISVGRRAAKTGVFLECCAINPINGEKIPIYAADYVLAEYGTGAIMAVPAHDERDLDFARHRPAGADGHRHGRSRSGGIRIAPGDGTYVNSPLLDGLTDKTMAVSAIIEELEARGVGHGATISACATGW